MYVITVSFTEIVINVHTFKLRAIISYRTFFRETLRLYTLINRTTSAIASAALRGQVMQPSSLTSLTAGRRSTGSG